MNDLQSLMGRIKSIFNISEENISSLNAMLRDIEITRINDRFNRVSDKFGFSHLDMVSKSNLLNAMTEIILENPSMNQITSSERKDVLNLLYEINSTIYERLMKEDSIKSLDKISIVVMYSMLSYLADKQTISNILIEQFNSKIANSKEMLDGLKIID